MIDGVVVVDKPKNITSHAVVQRVKRIYQAKKAGHTGTLDPIATGLLPICLGKATKLSNQLMAGDKEYEVEILMGVTTDTYDTEGEVTRRADVPTDILQQTEKLIPDFMGVVSQKPPYYSAVKYKGKPLYKWAREGRFIDVPPRDVEIKVFDLLGAGSDTVTARIVCSKGTYIRTLCHDLGEKLGIGACMKGLRRLATGPYNINDSVTLDKLETLSDINELRKYIIDI